MSQEKELETVKRRIKAFANRTVERGFSESEALHAAEMIGKLLTQFNLSMSEVMIRQEPCVQKVFETASAHRDFLSYGGVAQAIARFTKTKYWFSKPYRKRYGNVKWNFFGLESDVDMAIYLCEIFTNAFKNSWTDFKETEFYKNYTGHKRPLTTNFERGFGSRLNARLHEITNEKNREEARAAEFHQKEMEDRMIGMSDEAAAKFAEQTTGTALVLIAKEKRIEEEFKKTGLKLRNYHSNSNYQRNSGAREEGVKAANKVNIQRPMAHKGYGGTFLLTHKN